MTEQKKSFWTPFNVIAVTLFVSFCLYLYAGFFYPDRSSFPLLVSAYKFRVAILLFFPAGAVGLIFLYRAAYLKQIKTSSALLVLLLFFFISLLAFTVNDFRYNRSHKKQTEEFHTFLQLKPKDITGVDTTKYNIFCLGGSTTEFKDETGRDWPSLVEKKLDRQYGYKQIRLFNCGKQWYSTLHILIHYTQNVRPYKPDAIIVMENINDLLHNADMSRMSNGSFRSDYGHFLGPIMRTVKMGSYSAMLQESLASIWYQKKPAEIEMKTFPGLASFERNLRTIITLAKHDGTKVILMTQPNIYKEKMSSEELAMLNMLNVETSGSGRKWSYKTAFTGLNAYNDMIRKVAADEQVILVDLEKAVPKTTAYFYDDVHYKTSAYDLIAEYLSRMIRSYAPALDFSRKPVP
jgi:hypothetical protein